MKIPKPSPKFNTRLGVQSDVSFDERSILLNSGDILFLYTDGVIEAQGSGRRHFGAERLLASLETSSSNRPKDLKNTVRDALFNFSGQDFVHDDVTLLAIKISWSKMVTLTGLSEDVGSHLEVRANYIFLAADIFLIPVRMNKKIYCNE